jgi:CheY-like chemotaxis protein
VEKQESVKAVTILYVEDDHINQTVLKSMLSMIGYKNVLVAGDGKTTLELLNNNALRIDLIFMDLGLPDMNGYALAEKIRQGHFLAKNVPIIALTGNVAKVAKEKCLSAGMNGFLEKPINSQELLRVLEEALGKTKIT